MKLSARPVFGFQAGHAALGSLAFAQEKDCCL